MELGSHIAYDERMRIFACLASTLDGKIASRKAPRERFGSSEDLAHLLRTRDQADAILSGGETFRQFSGVRKAPHAERIPIQCILTRSFNLPPEASVFQKAEALGISIIVFSPDPAPDEIRRHYSEQVEWVSIGSDDPCDNIVQTLQARGVQTLSIEGGGEVVHLFLQSKSLQELYLTICPLLLGGRDDPALVSGAGFSVAQAPRTEVLSADWKGQELFLHLKLRYDVT